MSLTAGGSRLHWVDNVRTFMILLVVNMHACVTFSHVGGWYVKLPPEPDLVHKLPFIIWQGHLQSFFMGLLFFLAGYFAEKSLAKKGRTEFLRDRFLRLGLPTLLFMLVIHPFTVLVIMKDAELHSFGEFCRLYADYLRSGRFISASGPLWFAFALLIFSLCFAGLRNNQRSDASNRATPEAVHLICFCLLLVLTTFATRLVFPLETSFINFQLCFFPQYMASWARLI